MDLTENRNLRGGRSCWLADDDNTLAPDALPEGEVEIAIIGAGVMGAMLAERLSAQGHEIVMLDRRPPAHGSTAASTALVMWGADVPLTHLAETIGMDEAARRWRRVFAAVGDLGRRIDVLGIACGWIERPELYLAGSLLDVDALAREGEARRVAGLPSRFLAADVVADRFGIAPRAALLSAGSHEVDPVALTLGMIRAAQARGARVCFPFDVARLDQQEHRTMLHAEDGRTLAARHVIFATGYERPVWFLPPAFAVSSSYAIATRPGAAPLWRENAMIWEAASPYLYTRATADGRVIAGGEDEDFADGAQRDALIEDKAGTIQARLQAMIASDGVALDCAWSAAFGSSPDGLPAIGRVAGADRLWLASGFGGNGVTFAALGADMIAADFAGDPDPDAGCFSPYRFQD